MVRKDLMRRKIIGLVLLLILTVAAIAGQPAIAHDVWFTAAQDQAALLIVVHHGHPGDRKQPDPDKLFDLSLYDGRERTSWQARFHRVVQDGLPTLVSDSLSVEGQRGLWLLAGQYDNGYWVKTAEGYRNTSEYHFPQAEESLSSMKCAKMLVAINGDKSDAYQRVLGHPLELVPLANPFILKRGDRWPVQVLFDGQPLADVAVEATDGLTPMKEEDIPRYQTDHKGIVHIPIHRSGPLLLVIDYQRPGRHPDEAAVDRYNATFHVMLPDF